MNYYDRQGRPMTLEGYIEQLGVDNKSGIDQRRVAETTLKNGRWISTVYLALDHNFSGGPPLIFETMAFDATMNELDCDRYSTEAEALAGHERMCQKWMV